MRRWHRLLVGAAMVAAAAYGYWRLAVPRHRVSIRSELVMLGDLDGDRRWSEADLAALDAFLLDPFAAPDALAWALDLNQNQLLDEEDLRILRALVLAHGDPYAAESTAPAGTFPRPRELYRYVSLSEYRARPAFALPYPPAQDSVLPWLAALEASPSSPYARALDLALRAEAVRLDRGYRRREPGLLPIERDYAARKLARANELFRRGERYELLLAVMELVEDAETLHAPRELDFPLALLAFRDHLRATLHSAAYADFAAGRADWRPVLRAVSAHLEADLGLERDLETLGPARDLSNLENYLDRAEWQLYKSTAREQELLALVAYAQHDPRYLRAVSRTTRPLQDLAVENHNLPMVLLFREALRITAGDKKRAVGLLDEAIRVPYAWIKVIPREALPPSLAHDTFLLPGNKEDGADKSRHWNVFGGVCLYKSPQEALDLALRREVQDLRDDGYSVAGMREFLRDMIANLNGMYHVMAVDPRLLEGGEPPRRGSSAAAPAR